MSSKQGGTGMAPYAAESRHEIRTLGRDGQRNAEGQLMPSGAALPPQSSGRLQRDRLPNQGAWKKAARNASGHRRRPSLDRITIDLTGAARAE